MSFHIEVEILYICRMISSYLIIGTSRLLLLVNVAKYGTLKCLTSHVINFWQNSTVLIRFSGHISVRKINICNSKYFEPISTQASVFTVKESISWEPRFFIFIVYSS